MNRDLKSSVCVSRDLNIADGGDLCEEILDGLKRGISISKEDFSLSFFEVKGAIIEGTEVLLAASVNKETLLDLP